MDKQLLGTYRYPIFLELNGDKQELSKYNKVIITSSTKQISNINNNLIFYCINALKGWIHFSYLLPTRV